MTDQRDLLAREVDEELRREQLLKLWQQYGTYMIAAVVCFVLGIGTTKYFEHRRAVAAETAGAQFTTAARQFAQDKAADARKTFEEIAAAGPAGYATLARLRVAAADREAGKSAEAVTGYDAIAKERGVDPLLADYARLQAAILRLDSADWTEMQNRLNDLSVDGNAWRYSARELLGLAAHKAGKMEDARREFQRLIGDNTAPPGVAERARMMMALLTEVPLTKPLGDDKAEPPKSGPALDDKGKAKATDKKAK